MKTLAAIRFRLLSISLLFLLFASLTHASPPTRIVSLDLCTDWMLLQFAKPEQVLAYSPLLYQQPPSWVPSGLPTHDGSLEQIMSLQANLVITGEYNAIVQTKRLRQLGQGVEVMSLPTDVNQVQSYIQSFTQLLGSEILLDQKYLKTNENRNQTLLLLGANGIGTGRATMEHDMLTRAGWTNFLQSPGYLNLDLEQLVFNPPDAILWAAPSHNSMANLFANHSAVKQIMTDKNWIRSDYWRWQCPGPWIFKLIQELARWKNT